MANIIGLILCAAIYAWYLGQELADTRTSIERWTAHVRRGEWL